MQQEAQVKDKRFRVSIPDSEIQHSIQKVADKINIDLNGKQPLFLCVLNGAFMFASDLLKKISIDCEISFVKLASYAGTETTGVVKTLIGLDENVKGRNVVIVEDIVDTGITIDTLVKQLEVFQPASVKIATLLFKPEAYTKDVKIDYVALDVPPDFLVGYGLDYDGLGRNLKDIYTLIK